MSPSSCRGRQGCPGARRRDSEEVVREIEAHTTRDDEAPEEAIAGEPLVRLPGGAPSSASRWRHRSGRRCRRRCCRRRRRGCRAAPARGQCSGRAGPAAGRRRRRSAPAPRGRRGRARPSRPRRSVRRRRRHRAARGPPSASPARDACRTGARRDEHGLADRGEAEVTRLDDAGVDRPDRNLEDALTLGDEVRELVGGLPRRTRRVPSKDLRSGRRRPARSRRAGGDRGSRGRSRRGPASRARASLRPGASSSGRAPPVAPHPRR